MFDSITISLQDCDWLLFMDRFCPIFVVIYPGYIGWFNRVQYPLLSMTHRMVQFQFNIRWDCFWVNTSNDWTRFCKGKRTCVELGCTTGVCTIVRIGHAF